MGAELNHVALRESSLDVKEINVSTVTPSFNKQTGSNELLELDLLRSIAAIFMIVNHAGYRLLEDNLQRGGPMAALLFISSFAPVVFFFATGFGIGVSRQTKGAPPQMLAVLQKAGLLFIADQFLYWRSGVAFGFDFLAFIALASVLCSWVALQSSRFVIACVAIAVISVARFGVGPKISMINLDPLMSFLIGVGGITHISYPFSPWMALPALGLAAGLRYPNAAASLTQKSVWVWVSLAVALLFLILSGGAYFAGASFFRWGTMGSGFFAMSFAVIATVGWGAIKFSIALPRASAVLGLRGVASFAVVPVHYVAIDIAASIIGRRVSQEEFFVGAVMLILLSYCLSNLIATVAQRAVGVGGTALASGLVGTVLLCAFVLLFTTTVSTDVRMALMVFGQLAICGLLVFISRRRS